MDYVAFLNSSGAIVAPYGYGRYAANLHFAPYVEMVRLPVVSVDSSALYGDHPEKLATVTFSSGAALTFFCDSEAGGSNSSGDGSFDNPWRSMNTASRFLSCNACVFRTAAPYIQLKVKGTVEYISSTRHPLGEVQSKFIIRGWDGRCDLGSDGKYAARYFIDVRAGGYNYPPHTFFSCTVVGENNPFSSLMCECEFEGSNYASCIYNCSGAPSYLSTVICQGGSFQKPLWARYSYAPTVSYTKSPGEDNGALRVDGGGAPCAAVSAAVIVSGAGIVKGIGLGRSVYLADCNVSVFDNASGSDGAGCSAMVVSGVETAVTVSGGRFYAEGNAYASAVAEGAIRADVAIYGFSPRVTAAGATVTLVGSATAIALSPPQGRAWTESEDVTIYSGGSRCKVGEIRDLSNPSGTVIISAYPYSSCYAWSP